MKKHLFLLLIIPNIYLSQINNITPINLIRNEEFVKEELSKFDYFFLGETHDTINVSKSKYLLIDLLFEIKAELLFVEEPVYKIDDFFSVLNFLENDTSSYAFRLLTYNPEHLYYYKLISLRDNKKNRIQIIPIDNFSSSEITSKYILNCYKNKKRSSIVRNDLKKIKKIKKESSENERESIYLSFYDSLLKHKEAHLENIGFENYKKIDLFLKGIKTYNISYTQDSVNYFQSNEREDFMYENIVNKIKQNDSLKFISFNGHFHIPLNIPDEWVGVKNWESLAFKVKTAYPQKKVCSIYFMNRKDDSLSDKYFPTEKKLILDNIKDGETYLIRLDGENTPFKELSQKFQYIVVW